MKKINSKNINTPEYWDNHIAKSDFGLRQKKYLELAGKGESIIELGCGLSPFLNKARKNFKKAYGIDMSPKTIALAKKLYPKVIYTCENILDLGFHEDFNEKFDVSVAGEVIEHLKNPSQLISTMIRMTKRRIILSTAKMEYNDPEHLWEFSKEDFPMGKVEEVKSKRFPGRSYLFITIDL